MQEFDLSCCESRWSPRVDRVRRRNVDGKRARAGKSTTTLRLTSRIQRLKSPPSPVCPAFFVPEQRTLILPSSLLATDRLSVHTYEDAGRTMANNYQDCIVLLVSPTSCAPELTVRVTPSPPSNMSTDPCRRVSVVSTLLLFLPLLCTESFWRRSLTASYDGG